MSTRNNRDLFAAMQARIENQEAAIQRQEALIQRQEALIEALRVEVRGASGSPDARSLAARRSGGWRPAAVVLGLLLLAVASLATLPATSARQPADQAVEKPQSPSTSGDPLLVGRSNAPGITNTLIDETLLINPSNTDLARRLFRVANYSTSDIGTAFPASNYRVAIVGTTSGPDTDNSPRIGVLGAVEALASTSGESYGVHGYGKGPRTHGLAGSSINGIGAVLTGGQAPLLLTPAATNGPPTSGTHVKGELYVSADGNLYFCTAPGAPGQWTQLNLLRSYTPTLLK